MWCVYFLELKNGDIYLGTTPDLKRRDRSHQNGEVQSTKPRLAQENYDRQQQLFDTGVIAKAALDTFARNRETALQAVVAATAAEESARLAYSSDIEPGQKSSSSRALAAQAAPVGKQVPGAAR